MNIDDVNTMAGALEMPQASARAVPERVYRRRAILGYAEALRHAAERGPGETAELIKAARYDVELAIEANGNRKEIEDIFYLLRRHFTRRSHE